MRNIFAALIMLTAFAGESNAQEKVIPAQNLPKEIQSYITTHFPQQSILQAVKEREGLKTTYEISLRDLTKLEFNSRGKVFEIDGKSKLPDSVIPAKILAYIQSKHPENFIKSWEKDSREQTIELNNGLDLEFDLKDDFLRYDN